MLTSFFICPVITQMDGVSLRQRHHCFPCALETHLGTALCSLLHWEPCVCKQQQFQQVFPSWCVAPFTRFRALVNKHCNRNHTLWWWWWWCWCWRMLVSRPYYGPVWHAQSGAVKGNRDYHQLFYVWK